MRYLEKKAREVLSTVGIDPDASPSKVKATKDILRSVLWDAANVVDEARGEGYVDLRTLVTRISDLADRDVPGTGSGS